MGKIDFMRVTLPCISGLEHLGEIAAGIEQLEKAADVVYMMQTEYNKRQQGDSIENQTLLLQRS